MKILLYNPDNGVTRNFMPHLWMFLLKALTPPEHEVILVDGNAKPMNDQELVQFLKDEGIGLVGIGAMTRMIQKAYRVADAVRAAGIPVVMGGPHVTEEPDEALGKDGGLRHVDAVALGEADETWPLIIEDAARGELKEIYAPVDVAGKEQKPSLQPYPVIPWDTIDLDQFNFVPKFVRRITEKYGSGVSYFNTIPMESGRGCPYGCEFCTVTGFFGDQIRFRTNESVVNELLLLKQRAERDRGKITIFFIDDNFAINKNRTKSLLRDIIAADAQLPWIAQISANLLRDLELLDLMQEAGCKWVFIGMESIDAESLAGVNKSFNKPEEYAAVLNNLAQRGIYAMTSFIFGLDNDTPGVAERTLKHIESWPPGMPLFSPLVPLPGTPTYKKFGAEGRLTRPKHWLNFAHNKMAHTPLKISSEQVQRELDKAWSTSYSPENNQKAIDWFEGREINDQIMHFVMRMFFRGIYFPQRNARVWTKLVAQNRKPLFQLIKGGYGKYKEGRRSSPIVTAANSTT